MRACRHDIFENISENIFEDIFKETLRPRTRIVGRPTTSWHLASCDATSLPYCRSLPLAPSLPRSPLSLDLGVETVFPKNRRSWAWWNWEELTEGTV